MEAIGHAGTCLGILANDGVLLAAEKRNTNKLLDEEASSDKIYRLDEWVFCVTLLNICGVVLFLIFRVTWIGLVLGQILLLVVTLTKSCSCSDIACSVAGITSDANLLINELRLVAQRYFLQYQEPVPVENMIATICDVKQAYTQFGGMQFTIFWWFHNQK